MTLTKTASKTTTGLIRAVTGLSALITLYYYVLYFFVTNAVWDLTTAFYWTVISICLGIALLVTQSLAGGD